MAADLTRGLRTNYSYRLKTLNKVVDTYEFEGLPRVEKLRESFGRDAEKIEAKIQQFADQRKAKLDRDAADSARNVY
jgi:hypothetical protein